MNQVAVVGAGIVGLSTAFALKQRGAHVTVFDPAPPGSGQSAGQSRLFRHAHNDPRLVDFARRSRALWRKWQEDWGIELISDAGAAAIGPAVDGKRETLQQFEDIPVRTLDPEELHQVLPILADYRQTAMLDVDGGAIRTLSAIEALSKRLRDDLVADHVLSVRQTSSGTVEVRTGNRCEEFEHVVLCAGRGTAALAQGAGRGTTALAQGAGRGTTALAQGAGLTIPVEVAAHVRLTFPVRSDTPEPLPTFQDGSGAFGETGVYASPYPGNQFYSVGLSGTVEMSDDGSVADPAELASLADRTTAYVERALPGLDPRPAEYVHCWVTTLPWGEDGVGVWSTDGVSALVGHNLFKQAPALGEALAEAALGNGAPEQLRPDAYLGHD